LKADGWALVEQWATSEEAETLHLEFKRKKNPSIGEVEPADKGNVAKAMSSFANTSGGLLVFGVDADATSGGGFDRVKGVQPIANVERCAGAVERDLRQLTDPPVFKAEVFPVIKSGASGVFGVYVPASEGGPFRVIAGTREINDRYYMRHAAEIRPSPTGVEDGRDRRRGERGSHANYSSHERT
jgi:predicted HTH transcriptional regulator